MSEEKLSEKICTTPELRENCSCISCKNSTCEKPEVKKVIPAKDDFKALLAIYVEERRSILEYSVKTHSEWAYSVVSRHIEEIEKFTTIEQIDNDLREHLRMSFDEWYDTF